MVTTRTSTGAPLRHGFTLVELMVTLSIAAILLAVGVPPFSRLIANNRLATQTNEFVAALNTARSEAVRRGTGVSLRTDAGSLDYTGGWKVFVDADLDGGVPAAADVLRATPAFAGKTTLKRVTRTVSAGVTSYADIASSAADRMFLVFNGRGGNNAGGAAFFRICDTGNSALGGRIVQVSTVGRISLDSTTASCA
jgi:type IV fimbrial biogenesis protein FimT